MPDPQSVCGTECRDERGGREKKNRKEGYDLIDIYGDPAKFLKAVTIRTEEEEDYLVSQYGFI